MSTRLAYLFWSIVTSLLTTLFYFSVWELGLSGAEAALFIYLTPTLLGIAPIRNWAATRWGRVTLRLLSLIGLVAYKIDGPLERLWAVIVANVAVLLSQVADWTTCDTSYQGFRAFFYCFHDNGCTVFKSMFSIGCRIGTLILVQTCQSLEQSRCED